MGKRMLPVDFLAVASGGSTLSVSLSRISHWCSADTFDVLGTGTPIRATLVVLNRSGKPVLRNMVTGQGK